MPRFLVLLHDRCRSMSLMFSQIQQQQAAGTLTQEGMMNYQRELMENFSEDQRREMMEMRQKVFLAWSCVCNYPRGALQMIMKMQMKQQGSRSISAPEQTMVVTDQLACCCISDGNFLSHWQDRTGLRVGTLKKCLDSIPTPSRPAAQIIKQHHGPY